MHRRDVLRSCVGAGVVPLAGCFGGRNEPLFREGFEDGIDDWEAGAAIGPEVDIEAFEWELDVSGTEAAEGERSLRIWNGGDYDDGVTWGVHSVSIEPGEAYDVTVSAQFWSESESFNLIRSAVMYLGPEPPEFEEDFPHPGVNTSEFGETPHGGLREPLWLTDGWRTYTFGWTTPELSTETLYIALGTAVVWETDATHYVDDIVIEADPR